MIVDGLDQNGLQTGAVTAQGVCKDLVAGNGTLGRLQAEHFQAFPDALAEGLLRVGNAGHAVLAAEHLYPIPFTVGNHAELNRGFCHLFQPADRRPSEWFLLPALLSDRS